jgi:hypothetical protein
VIACLCATGLTAEAAAADRGPRPQQAERASVLVTPRAVLIEEQHYQATFPLTCNDTRCRARVPVPDGFDRLVVRRYSCDIRGPTNSQFVNGTFAVVSPTGRPLVTMFKGPSAESSDRGIFIINLHPWSLYITAPNSGVFFYQLTHPVDDGACTVLGVVRAVSTSAARGTVEQEPVELEAIEEE